MKDIISKNIYSFWKKLDNSIIRNKYSNFEYILNGKNNSNKIWNIDNNIELISEFYDLFNNKYIYEYNPKWYIEECDKNKNLKELFQKNELVFLDSMTGMALDLERYKYNNIENDYLIKQLETEDDISDFSRIICNVFWDIEPKENHKIMFDFYKKQRDIRLFIGYYYDIPVSTGALYINQKTAGIYYISTQRNFRNKGFGRRITEYISNYAKEIGLKYAVLGATKSGEKVYEKIGYKKYIEYSMYSRLK